MHRLFFLPVPAFFLLSNYYHVVPITQLRNHHSASLIILMGSTLVRELMTVLDQSGRDRCGFVRTAVAARHLLPTVIMPDVLTVFISLRYVNMLHVAEGRAAEKPWVKHESRLYTFLGTNANGSDQQRARARTAG